MCDSYNHENENKGFMPTIGAKYRRLPFHGKKENEEEYVIFRK